MLTIKHRQQYLKNLGYYKGKIDGYWGKSSKDAMLRMKKKYYPKKWQSRIYTKGFDRLLVSANRVRYLAPHFKIDEFVCGCGGRYCSSMPVYLNKQLLINLENVRRHFGKPITVTCGVRCKKYNRSLVGSIPNSQHTKGKAVDIYIGGLTDTLGGRKTVMAYWKRLPKYGYTYCNENGNHPNMGNAVHMDVR